MSADREAVDLDALVVRAEALLAVADRATPPPWREHRGKVTAIVPADGRNHCLFTTHGPSDIADPNMKAIAALRNDAPALIRDLLAALGDNLTTKES